MKIWKCDMCGKVLEKDTDVFVVSCNEPKELDEPQASAVGVKSVTCYREYELCSGCAKKTEKFIRNKISKSTIRSIKEYCSNHGTCGGCVFMTNKNTTIESCIFRKAPVTWTENTFPELKGEEDDD